MAITFVNATTYSSGASSTSSVSLAYPASIAANDVLIAQVLISSSTGTITTPAGWTLIRSDTGNNRRSSLYSYVATGSESGSVAFTLSASFNAVGGMGAFRGVDTTAIVDANAGQTNSSSSTSCTAPTVTATATGGMLLTFSSAVGNVTFTPATGQTERYDVPTTAASSNCSIELGTETLAASGATGTRASTISGSVTSLGQNVILKQAVVVSVTTTPDGYSERLDVVLTDASGARVAQYATLDNIQFKTDKNGFKDCTIQYTIDPLEGYRLYSLNTVWNCKVMDGGAVVYDGRVEDVQLNGSSMQVTAFGYWRALSDIPYTALWSVSSYDAWRPTTSDQISVHAPEKWEIKTDGMIYFAPKKNETFGTPNYYAGAAYVATPSGSTRSIVAVTFTYKFYAPANWVAEMSTRNSDFTTGAATVWSLTGTGAVQAGTTTITFTGKPILLAGMYYNTTAAQYTNDTGAIYFKLTDVRVMGTTAASVTTATIAGDMVATVAATNSTQISSSVDLLNSTGVDLTDAVYEDASMADVLQALADQGDSSGNRYEVGVYRDKQLYFRQKGSAGRTWYVDIDDLELERTIDTLVNSAYASYKDANNTTVRSSSTSDTASIARYGLTRRSFVNVDTTSSAQASAAQTALLTDQANPLPKARISFSRVYNAAGGQYPLYYVRSGDAITIRNLPPNLGSNVDRIRTFRISETSYTASSNTLDVTPEEPIPTLDRVIAQTA